MADHLLGLLLGTEDDWPTAFEALVARLPQIEHGGETHTFRTERIVNEPFDLRYRPRYSLVIDRLSWWYHLPREWLKKISLMDDVYLLNNPFTFQAMEKHAAYCAMIRLGLKVPPTWLIPHKAPPRSQRFESATARFEEMASRYNAPFDLEAIGEKVGYPLYMKPFDGGQWVGVTRIDDAEELRSGYDSSGERLMHLQQAVDGYDIFVRSLSIGAETMVMHYDPDQPLHARYNVSHGFLSPNVGGEVVTISRLVNAFFRWEFNSCETLIRDDEVFPIDYANASPDVALTSLHYYFPWAMAALVRWCAFCAVTRRPMRINQNTRAYFDIGDRAEATYEEKLSEYRRLADDYFQIEAYRDFVAEHLSTLDEIVLDYVDSPEFDTLIVETVRSTFPAHEHEHFTAHYRGLLASWVSDARGAVASVPGPA
jgi:hypothetical protein